MPKGSNRAAPIPGVGIGLRGAHVAALLQETHSVPWLEVLIDNYLNDGGIPQTQLEQLRAHYPLTFHAVGMSLGSTDPLNLDYLQRLKTLMARFQPLHVSDHLCWSSVDGRYAHDLLPLPYREETIRHVADRISRVQDVLGQQILVENVSTYLQFRESNMPEWAFLSEVAARADCHILLDVNNIYVSARNTGFDPLQYLAAVPATRVKEIHLAGYETHDNYLLDSHSEAVHPPVWALYRHALQRLGPIATLIEWDSNVPPLDRLQREATTATAIMREATDDVA